MADEAKIAPAEEAKPSEPANPEAEAKAKEDTIGEALETTPKKEESKMVPEAALIEMKREKQAAYKELKELKKSIEEGATVKEVRADLKALADKHGVDEEFLQDFAKAVRQQTEEEVEGKMAAKLKPLEEKERAEKIDKAFNQHFSKAMDKMPEYKDLVNPEVIKTLSLSPGNSGKTFTQLIEETYGHSIQGKRSIDAASTRAGKSDSAEVDMKRMSNDTEYYKEVMASPALKSKYNSSLTDRLRL